MSTKLMENHLVDLNPFYCCGGSRPRFCPFIRLEVALEIYLPYNTDSVYMCPRPRVRSVICLFIRMEFGQGWTNRGPLLTE